MTLSGDQIEILRQRLGDLIDRATVADETREVAAEALEELAVAIEEIQAQNVELSKGQELLEAERKRYRTLFHTLPDGFVITTTKGMITQANQTAADLLGRPLERVIRQPLASFVSPDDRRSFYAHLGRLDGSDVGDQINVNLSLSDHVEFPANLRATLLPVSPGLPASSGSGLEIRWMIHDRRNEIESDELRVSEERLRSLFETAQVGILLCDHDGSISFSNRHADRLLGRRQQEFDLADWTSTIHADDRAAVDEMVLSISRGGPARSLRYRVVQLGEVSRWVDQTTTPLRRSESGGLAGSVSTLTDSTAEVDAAADLRRSRDFADALLDTVGALVVVLDRELRIVRFNKACEEATGWTSDDVLGRSAVESMVPPEQQASVEQLLLGLLSSRSAQSAENDLINRDGERLRVTWHNTVVVDDDDEVVAIISTGIDVTRQRLLESRLAQTDRLESVGRLAAGIAHDFNNTLAVLRLRVERLPVAGTAQRENVEALLRTIEHSQSTVADLLSFSRHQELVQRATEVNAEIERLANMLPDLLGDDIEIVIELTDDDTTTMLDPARFEQIVVNLAVNARDAMAEGGTLTLGTGVVDVSGRPQPRGRNGRSAPAMLPAGRYVCLSVIDTGTGIPPDDVERVFDPYFTTKPPGRGTGLGLATAYGTINQSGGEITVDSELGSGTTFTLWLPKQETSPEELLAVPAPSSRPTQAAVLLVEDDADLREILGDELRQMCCDTVEAVDGTAGLEMIGQPFDLLVTDVQMPGVDGVELAAAFVANAPRRNVLFITGLTPKELHDQLPADAHILRKPFSIVEFRTAVERLLDSSS
jgi:two-component system, cell cycle sensor histidine kinase and response regulator CckA